MAKEQELIKEKQKRKKTKLAEEKAERKRQEKEQQENEICRNVLIEHFERLDFAEQEQILDQVQKAVPKPLLEIFKRNRKENRVHKVPMFVMYFDN